MSQLQEFAVRNAHLAGLLPVMEQAAAMIEHSYRNGGKLLLAGNGGSASDAEHIAGELLKSFVLKRPASEDFQRKLEKRFGEEGVRLGTNLQCALPCLSLLSHPAFRSAFGNDEDGSLDFAQQLFGQGREGDVFLGISTGGNSKNIRSALMVAQAMGIGTILLTGAKAGSCRQYADLVIAAPEQETYRIQECHLPIYHALCLELEERFFGKNGRR
ncbi:MAG: SIS domain-containing protein [Victivallaceae bacterium]|nr:SIS domain-containing protein [Victivallaceae bacterium]